MAEQVIMDDIHIHGGVVQEVVCMGDVHMHGGVVNTMTVQGDCTQHGGVINRRIQQTGAQATYQQQEPKVIYRDRVVYKDRVKYRDNTWHINEINRLQNENERLRQTLQKKDEQQPSDDILISKIQRLESQLNKEREAHRKEVDELNWRLKAVTDIANGRNAVNYEQGEVERQTRAQHINVSDDTFDVLFTLINEYPICNDSDKAEELGITTTTLRYIAKALRLAKSPEQRREARERLQRHGIDLIERRGGDQTKNKKKSKTTKTKRQ